MVGMIKSSFFRLFATGFVAGAIGVVALQPAPVAPVAPPTAVTAAR